LRGFFRISILFGAVGTLCIAAYKGQFTTELPRFDGGNVIDIPALKWLAQQAKRRIWISDGIITGVDDKKLVGKYYVEAEKVQKSAGIVRYLNLETFFEEELK